MTTESSDWFNAFVKHKPQAVIVQILHLTACFAGSRQIAQFRADSVLGDLVILEIGDVSIARFILNENFEI